MIAWYTGCWGRGFGEQVTDFPTRWTPNATHEAAEKQFKKYVISSKSVADALKN